MSKSYTPGLKILENTKTTKERILPLKGEVHVSENDIVDSDKIVASTDIPGNVHMVNIANKLNIDAKDILSFMLLNENDEVVENQTIAKNKGIFGFFKTEIKSPVDGSIINISDVTGQVVISEKPLSIDVDAYIPGVVSSVVEKEGVIIKSNGTFIQGIIGVGGEKQGFLKVLISSHKTGLSKKELQEIHIKNNLKDKIIVCGDFIDYEFYKAASEIGIKGIVCGGFDYDDISKILGKSLGVAITGTEKTMNLILTEGFGKIEMAERTFDILKKNDGKDFNEENLIISEGSIVRIIREPFFGEIGEVVSLPPQLIEMKSETKVRVAKIKFPSGKEEIIPRANLEVILSW